MEKCAICKKEKESDMLVSLGAGDYDSPKMCIGCFQRRCKEAVAHIRKERQRDARFLANNRPFKK